MELVRTKFILEFSAPFNPWIEMRDLIRDVGELTTSEIQGPPLVMDVPDKKQRVEIHIKSFVLHQEGKSTLKESSDVIIEKIEKIRNTIGVPRIAKVGFSAQFIDPYNLSFQDLLIKFKARFFQSNSIVDFSNDAGISLTMTENEINKFTQIGPMGKEQLSKTLLIWKRTPIPDNFIYIENVYESLGETDYDPDKFRDLINSAYHWQEDNALNIFKYLSEGV